MYTDVKLTVVNINDVLMLESKEDMTQQTFQVKQGTVNLECSLGLISHRDRELLDMNLRFVFTSAHSDVEKAVSCNESNPQIVDNWVVTPNMNENTCHLKIMNFSKVDDGRYDCLMVLINSHTLYNQDNSNVVVLAAESTLKPSKKQNTNENDFGHLESGLFYFIVSLMVVTVLPLLAISIAVVIRKVRKHRELQGLNHHPAPAPNLNYGTSM